MSSIRIIPSRSRRSKVTGEVISMFSTLPHGSYDDWEVITNGYTWEKVDNRGNMTTGMGRRPVKTLEEAEAVVNWVKEVNPTVEVLPPRLD